MTMRLVLAFVALGVAAASEAHPIGKVVTLLQKLEKQSIEEGKNEEVSFSKFSYWCSTSIDELKGAIEEEKATIDELESSIEGFKQEIASLADQIKELTAEIKQLQADAKTAKDKDAKRTTAYNAKLKDLKATSKAMSDAITAMNTASKTDSMLLQESAQNSVAGALALLSMKTTDEQQAMLVDFVSGKPKQLAAGDEGAHVKKYSFKSDNVIELLKELKLKFEDDITAATTEETAGANAYKLEKLGRDNAEKAATKSNNQKKGTKSDTEGSLSEAEGSLKDEKADLKADEGSLDTTDKSCKTKTREWEERSSTRSNEIEAIRQATKILAKSAGVRTEAPSNPVPPTSPVKFLQIDSDSTDPKSAAVNLLRTTAQTVHSKALERLALEVSTHLTGPFDKVNDMIQKMIFRLMAEQTDEDKHKAWCDLELDKTKDSKEDKEDKIKQLDLDIKSENAAEAKNTLDITAADKMVADIVDFMNEATEIRQAGKHENKVSIKDAKDAQTAIANAHAVLEDFYKSSGEISMMQGPVKLPKDPKLWSAGYTGVSDPKNAKTGVLSILETCAADFSKMEADTKAQEAEDQKDYDSEMSSHKIEKDRRATESAAKVSEKKRHVQKAGELTAQKKHTNDELDAVKQYSKDLQPACVDGDSSFKDRKAARAKEIKALKSAQKTLQEAFKKKSSSFLQIHAA